MVNTSIVQIVPRMYPVFDGLGDYGLNLARRLQADFGTETQFIVGDPSWHGNPSLDKFLIRTVTDRSATALLSCLKNSSVVLVHYVGYGYEKRGCPSWLIEGLEHWKKEGPKRTLITMFHEVYASGPFWTSSFWLSPTQRHLAARLAIISSHIITNKELYANILRQLLRNDRRCIYVLPVFSNVGEPEQTPLPLLKRKRHLVVFGNRGHRQLVFQKSIGSLKRVCRALGIEEIFDVGALIEHDIKEIDGIKVTCTGVQPAHRVSALLSEAIAGFFNYPTDYLGKSTIFAAYCAHRLLPIGVYYNERSAEGLHSNRHFLLADRYEGDWNLSSAQLIADDAYNWYQDHTLSKQAEVFAARIAANDSTDSFSRKLRTQA